MAKLSIDELYQGIIDDVDNWSMYTLRGFVRDELENRLEGYSERELVEEYRNNVDSDYTHEDDEYEEVMPIVEDLQPYDKIHVELSNGLDYEGQFRARIKASDAPVLDTNGDAIWVTTDNNTDVFITIDDICEIWVIENYRIVE